MVVVVMVTVGVTLVVLVTVVVPAGVVVVVVVSSSKQAKICRSLMTKASAWSAGASGTIFRMAAKTLLGRVTTSLPAVVVLKVCSERERGKYDHVTKYSIQMSVHPRMQQTHCAISNCVGVLTAALTGSNSC